MAADDLATLAQVQAVVGTKNPDDNAYLGDLITQVSAFIRVYCDIDVYPVKTYTDEWYGNGISPIVVLVNRPVVSIESVTGDYQGVIPAWTSTRRAGWRARGNILRLDGYTPGKDERIVVAYHANFSTVPPEIARTTCSIVAYLYRRRTRIDEVSKSIEGAVITYDTKNVGDAFSLEMLEHYKRRIAHTGGSFP